MVQNLNHSSAILEHSGSKTVISLNGARLIPALILALAGFDATAQDAQADNERMVLEEVIVMAEAREENLQVVPVAITAFSATDILEAGIETTADFIALTPNVSFDDSFTVGNSFISVRGVTQINNADSPVAIIVDGVPQNNQKQFKMDLYDVERIEVLKGPQGALYGRNALGGAINIVTRQPGNELDGYVQLGFGNGGLKKFSGAVSGPLIDDTLMFRISASVNLANKHARPLLIFGVVLDHDGGLNTVDHFTGKDTIVRHLVISMRGDSHFPAPNKLHDSSKSFAHVLRSRFIA